MVVIGVTGSLASGKSEVARLLKKRGARVFDADEAARLAVRKGKPAYRAILKIFGRDFLSRNGELDRTKLAARVFSKPRDLEKLNILIHPSVIFDALEMIETLKKTQGILVLDVPLLFESRMENLADRTLVVTASRKTLLRRAAKKGIRPELTSKILASQWPIQKKVRLADFVISNDGTLAELEKKVLQVLEKLQPPNKGDR